MPMQTRLNFEAILPSAIKLTTIAAVINAMNAFRAQNDD